MLKLISNQQSIKSLSSFCNKLFYSKNESIPNVNTLQTTEEAAASHPEMKLYDHYIITEHILNSVYEGKLFHELPIITLKACKNNTKVNLTDCNGTTLVSCTCGTVGFANSRKCTTVAAQTVGLTVGFKAKKLGLNHVRVVMKGPGLLRLSCINGIIQTGVKIVSLTDNSPIHLGLGRRPKKKPRL